MASAAMHVPVEATGHGLRVTKDPGIIKVNNETHATSSRITRSGRRITYKARIIQQPNRARACGSGAKSCADRRPVDPPPIIELRIYEGPAENETEITYEYNANFFVFATLEHARHMATGRLPNSAQNNVPVLTGSPVAGMALLERPSKAGYFIFPDLSVRHEGKYRLNFSLYEELKNVKDMDSEIPDHPDAMKSAHVSHRLEVKTVPFTVFSAKKFPGLTLSTPLSVTFAEQGCRVRIRRDIRLRRRNDKGGPMEMEAEPYYDHRRVSATPDAYHPVPSATHSRPPSVDHTERPRSSSVHSNGHVRRLSTDQAPAPYQQDPYAASPQAAPGMYPPQGSWPQQTSDMSHQQPPQHYAAPQYPVPAPPAHSMAPPPYAYNGHHPQQYSADPARQSSSPRSTTSPQMSHSHSSPHAGHSAPAYAAPKPYQPQIASLPTPPASTYHTSRVDSVHQASSLSPPDHAYHRQPAQINGVKRDYGSSFDTQAMEQPLRHGARPTSNGLDPKFGFGVESNSSNSDDDSPIDISAMSYRRADGSYSRRSVPLPQ